MSSVSEHNPYFFADQCIKSPRHMISYNINYPRTSCLMAAYC